METALAQRVFALAAVEERGTTVSAPGARAIWLRDNLPAGPKDAFLGNREISHSSLGWQPAHCPAPDLAEEGQGRLGRGPLVARAGIAPEHIVMLYGPRDEGEVQVLFDMIAAAVDRAAGQ